MPDIVTIWAAILAFSVLAYVVLDGFDLGLGILFLATPRDEERNLMLASIAPVWDGNQTWLVMGGGALLAAFPLAYGVVMPALYMPITAMVLALIFRGVAFKFRDRNDGARSAWDAGFAIGSLVATFAQGVTLGALVEGLKVTNGAYAGGAFDWLSPFSVLTGLALVVGYSLLGATWLIWRTTGRMREKMRRYATFAMFGTLGAIGLVSALTPFMNPAYAQRWFAAPAIYYSALVPALVALAGWALWRALTKPGADHTPFLAALSLFVLSFIGLGVSFYPYIVPPSLTLEQAASDRSSLAFLLAGGALLIPMVIGYNIHAYWTFRGKVRDGDGYH